MDAVWDGRSDGSRDEAGSWVWGLVHRRVILGANMGHPIVTNGSLQSRGPFPFLLNSCRLKHFFSFISTSCVQM